MKNQLILTAVIVALLGTAPAGAQSTPPDQRSETTAPQNDPAASDKAMKKEARMGALKSGLKGCGVGAALSAVGALFGGKVSAKGLAEGCAVAGVTTGVIEYRSQLKEARELQGKVTVGAVATVQEKEVIVDGKPTQAMENLTLKLDAAKVDRRSADIETVMSEASAMLNRQKIPMTVTCQGQPDDRAWFCGQLRAQVANSQITFEDEFGPAPVVVISPMPVME